MKNRKKSIIATVSTLVVLAIAFAVLFIPANKDIYIVQGRETEINLPVFLQTQASIEEDEAVNVNGGTEKTFTVRSEDSIKITAQERGTISVKLKAFGFIPVGSVNVHVLPDISLCPGGWLIGIKMNTRGVIVVGLEEMQTSEGEVVCPAKLAGIEVGDVLYEINGEEVNTADDVKRLFAGVQKKPAQLRLKRGKEDIKTEISAVLLDDNTYKIGLWARDNIAGIGTMTFYDENKEVFASLGHSINDVTTGIVVPVKDGSIVNAHILSVVEGQGGTPGEIRGIFYDEDEEIGTLTANTEYGLYGKLDDVALLYESDPLPIATQSEVKEGAAQIISMVDGEAPKAYDIVIEKKYNQKTKDQKGMLLRVVDEELLAKTGGIVQGMSGSPIIQDGKIIGAVTHVLVNDPTKGYGIFVEWMINEAGI